MIPINVQRWWWLQERGLLRKSRQKPFIIWNRYVNPKRHSVSISWVFMFELKSYYQVRESKTVARKLQTHCAIIMAHIESVNADRVSTFTYNSTLLLISTLLCTFGPSCGKMSRSLSYGTCCCTFADPIWLWSQWNLNSWETNVALIPRQVLLMHVFWCDFLHSQKSQPS